MSPLRSIADQFLDVEPAALGVRFSSNSYEGYVCQAHNVSSAAQELVGFVVCYDSLGVRVFYGTRNDQRTNTRIKNAFDTIEINQVFTSCLNAAQQKLFTQVENELFQRAQAISLDLVSESVADEAELAMRSRALCTAALLSSALRM